MFDPMWTGKLAYNYFTFEFVANLNNDYDDVRRILHKTIYNPAYFILDFFIKIIKI